MIATRRRFLMLAAAGLVAGGIGLSSAWAQVPDGSTIVLSVMRTVCQEAVTWRCHRRETNERRP
jgi:hypothetical protein